MIPRASLWNGIRALCYKQNGGSGTNLTKNEILDLEIQDFLDWLTWLKETREYEKEAHK